MSEKNIALKLTDVEFRRRKRVILTKVNLEINKGEKWVLFGPNGIGKSSLVQMMSTRGFPSEGTVDILGNTWSDEYCNCIRVLCLDHS